MAAWAFTAWDYISKGGAALWAAFGALMAVFKSVYLALIAIFMLGFSLGVYERNVFAVSPLKTEVVELSAETAAVNARFTKVSNELAAVKTAFEAYKQAKTARSEQAAVKKGTK